MASSLMHYAITDKILQLFPMHDGARLRFGAVLPDASVNKRKTHFRIYNEKLGIRLYDLESYRAQFGERMQKDDLYLGYYLHLIEDALYRKTLYDTFGWNPYTPESTARMHHDYTLLNRHLILTTLIISKKPGNTGISRDIRTEFTTDLLLSD